MVCYDGSDRSRNALDKALELFAPQKPDIMILMVVENPGDASMENEGIVSEWLREHQDKLREAAERVTDQGYETDAILATGDPRNMIIEAIEKKSPDLVVLAKRGHSRVDRMLLGSVSTFVVRHSSVPVLVIRKQD